MTIPLLITRPKEQSEELAETVSELMPGKFEPIVCPLLEIRSEPGSLDIAGAQALLFTSRAAVVEFSKRSDERHLPALCVGDATAEVATSFGFSSMSADGDVSALATLAAASYLPDLGYFVHFRGGETAGDLVGALAGEGIPAEERIIYDQFPLFLSDETKARLKSMDRCVATVFSPRSANLLADELPSEIALRTSIVSISVNASLPFQNINVREVSVAKVPKLEAILEILAAI